MFPNLKTAFSRNVDSAQVKDAPGKIYSITASYAANGANEQVWIQLHDLRASDSATGQSPLMEEVCFKGLTTALRLPQDGLVLQQGIRLVTSTTSGICTPTSENKTTFYALYV